MPDALVSVLVLGWRGTLLAFELLALLSIPSVLVRRRGRPQSALSWMLALLALPIVGLCLWWLIGRSHMERRRRRRRYSRTTIEPRLKGLRPEVPAPPSLSPKLAPLWNLPAELSPSVFRPVRDNAVRLLPGGDGLFETMEQDIVAARHHIHAQFYIWRNDETGQRFRDLLIEKARQGVEVRVLCDAVGSPAMATRFSRRLRRAGAQVRRFLPPGVLSLPRINFRNHRKILVVDGQVGVIGGFNIADEYRYRWRDMALRIVGPAVDQLQEVFADDWYYANAEDLASPGYFGGWADREAEPSDDPRAACAVIASGPDSHYTPIHDALFMAINQAEQRVWITTPYFIPSRPILTALRTAAFRGVDVRIMLPGSRNDIPVVRFASRSFYPQLLEVGCRIFEYQPAMHHAKTALFDGALVMIGSANLDSRSFRLNFEASCFVGSEPLNERFAEVFERDIEGCRELDLAQVEEQPWVFKLVDSTAHLLSPLL